MSMLTMRITHNHGGSSGCALSITTRGIFTVGGRTNAARHSRRHRDLVQLLLLVDLRAGAGADVPHRVGLAVRPALVGGSILLVLALATVRDEAALSALEERSKLSWRQ